MDDIRSWLTQLGLGKHADVLLENDVDFDVLPELTEDDLREFGFTLGDRKRLLKAARGLAEADAAPPVAASGAERRQLTVMFCDLAGSTALSARLDPEVYRDFLSAYQDAARTAIERYDGYIARYMGDGLLVYFGYPQAHEDDPERAVRAGLDVVDTVRRLDVDVSETLAVRIGISTGLVVAGDIIGEGASEERAVLGETPNLAARLQGLADLNAVLISDATRRLVRERFELEALGPHELKGIGAPVPVFRAVRVLEGSRFDAGATGPLAELTGRDREMSALWRCWQEARGGNGTVVVVSGEPGIGKSRLVQELAQRAQATRILRYQCSPYHTGSAFHPFIEQVQRDAGLHPEDNASQRVDKLADLLQRGSAAGADLQLALFASMLSLPSEAAPPLDMSPQRRRAKTIAGLNRYLSQGEAGGATLVIFEDVHWIDPSSEEVISRFVRDIQALPILVLVTHRPEYRPAWDEDGLSTALVLDRLAEDGTLAVMHHFARGRRLPEEVVAQIVSSTDGVPLFVEELTKDVLESGLMQETDDGFELLSSPKSLSIPATLRDSLLARLDRLGAVKSIAQFAACIGREFSPKLLGVVTELGDGELQVALSQLVDAGLVYRSGAERATNYTFKHALVQDAASDSLLTSARRSNHARIVEALETGAGDEVEPERLAWHCSLAGQTESAIQYFLKAGSNALSSSSLPEANAHLTAALELTAEILDEQTRREHELEVRTLLGSATMAQHGWPSPLAREVVEPACALFERGIGDSRAFINLWNLWVHHGCRGEHERGLDVVQQMLAHAANGDEHVLALMSSFTASMAHLWIGNYGKAGEFEQAALEIYDFESDHGLAWQYNHDPKNTLLSWGSQRIWALGFPDRARRMSDEAVDHARAVGHPFNLCWTLGNSSFVYANCGDPEPAEARMVELGEIAQHEGLDFIEAYMVPANRCVHALCLGDFELAYAEGERAEAIWGAIGGRFWSPMVCSCMAQSAAEVGRMDEALDIILRTIEQIETTGERMYAEEIYRIAGRIHAMHGDDDRALQLYEQSLQYARQHGTRSLELRTVTALAEIEQRSERSGDACAALASAYDRFGEGHETMDLVAASRLLAHFR